jgi:hypothetical protein
MYKKGHLLVSVHLRVSLQNGLFMNHITVGDDSPAICKDILDILGYLEEYSMYLPDLVVSIP